MIALPPIELVVVGEAFVPPELMSDLAGRLHDFLGTKVTVRRGRRERGEKRARAKKGESGEPRRLSSDDLLDVLIERGGAESGSDSCWTLGVTSNDLYAEGRGYVFGEATVGGNWALVSSARFGVTDDLSARLCERLLKESLHELGHLASAGHCGNPECLMSIAKSVADIDAKKLEFCEECRNRIFPTDPLVTGRDAR